MRRWGAGGVIALLLGGVAGYQMHVLDRCRHAWFSVWSQVDDPRRDREPATAQILSAVDARPGMRIADVGAGVGYFSFKFASAVGDAGRIFATDADGYAVIALWVNRWRRRAWNVTPMQTEWGSIGLPSDPLDRIVLVNVYPFEECHPRRTRRFFNEARDRLVEGGKIVLFQDSVHDARWHPPVGQGLGCAQPDGAALVRSLPEGLEVESLQEAAGYKSRGVPGETAGYLLIVRRHSPSPDLAGDEAE